MRREQLDNIVFTPGPSLSPRIIAQGSLLHFPKKQVIFRIGTFPEKLHYILSGMVRVVELSKDSERLVLFNVMQRRFVCDVRFLAELPLTFQVESLTNITMVAFSRETVYQLMSEDPDFRKTLFLGIAEKMRKFGENMIKTAYDNNQSRLLTLLEHSVIKEDGTRIVAMSQQELAEHLGVHRVTINRILRRLQAQGRISITRERIFLHD